MEGVIILIVGLIIIYIFYLQKNKLKKAAILRKPFPDQWKVILEDEVDFYRSLTDKEKEEFRKKVQLFLATTNITGVQTVADDKIKILVASSAIIPVFCFQDWDYFNLEEVLVYPGHWSEKTTDEQQEGLVLGQVRSFQNNLVLRLSRQALIQGFKNSGDKRNVGIHEFAHMVDHADGNVDGRPEAFLPKELWKPWTKLMHQEIKKIRKGKSDLNEYGATNEAEFFAVVTEYFFERPQLFKTKHPSLYKMLRKIFRR